MSLYIQSYLTDENKIQKIWGCKNKLFFEKVLLKLGDDLEDLDSDHEDIIDFNKNAKTVLLDFINGKVQFKEIAFMYGYVYEKLVATFGEQIYAPNDEYSVEYFQALDLINKTFVPIPFDKHKPFIYSIAVKDLVREKNWFLGLTKPDDMNSKDFEMEQNDFKYIFDKAIEQQKAIVFIMA